MVDSENFKKIIKQHLPQDYEIEFLGNNFDQIVHQITEAQAEKIYAWIEEVVKNKIQPIFVGSNKTYKDGMLISFLHLGSLSLWTIQNIEFFL